MSDKPSEPITTDEMEVEPAEMEEDTAGVVEEAAVEQAADGEAEEVEAEVEADVDVEVEKEGADAPAAEGDENKDEDKDVNTSEEDGANAGAGAGSPAPETPAPKKPLSAYFMFGQSKRAELKATHPDWSVAQIAKETGALWKQLTPEEKKDYTDRHAEAMSEWKGKMKELGLNPDSAKKKRPTKSGDGGLSATELAFPLARLKKIVKTDSDIKTVSKDGYTVIGKSTEHFLQYLASKLSTRVMEEGRKQITPVDFASLVHEDDSLEFLRKDFSKPNHTRKIKKPRTAHPRKPKVDEPVTESNTIFAYFGKK